MFEVICISFAFFLGLAVRPLGLPPLVGFLLEIGMSGLPDADALVFAEGALGALRRATPVRPTRSPRGTDPLASGLSPDTNRLPG